MPACKARISLNAMTPNACLALLASKRNVGTQSKAKPPLSSPWTFAWVRPQMKNHSVVPATALSVTMAE